MPVVHFYGRVFPLNLKFTFQDLPKSVQEAAGGLKMVLTPVISGSDIHVECQVNRCSGDDKSVLLVRSRDIVQAIIDMSCFCQGIGATVVIERFVGTNGRVEEIVPWDKSLGALCTAFRPGPAPNADFAAVLGILLREPPLFMALNDLILAITIPHHAPVNCGRAIEGIRSMIAPGESTEKQWYAMRANLRISKDYLKLITDTSTAPRHGDRSYIPGPKVQEIIRRSWVVMDRLLQFRKRGNQPLPAADFPELVP